MFNVNLTKADKRRCRELIHLGLERECEKFVKDTQKLANKPIPLAEMNEPYREENGWSVEGPWHKRYIALYRLAAKFDKHVARRYDGMTGGRYVDCVLGLYLDGIITEEDIAQLSDDVRDFIHAYENTFR